MAMKYRVITEGQLKEGYYLRRGHLAVKCDFFVVPQHIHGIKLEPGTYVVEEPYAQEPKGYK